MERREGIVTAPRKEFGRAARVVPEAGLEPAWGCPRWSLKPISVSLARIRADQRGLVTR
jgi:hypothetical protein